MGVAQVGQGAYIASGGFIVEDGKPNDRPPQPTFPDNGFLTVLVGINVAHKKRVDQLVEDKTAMFPAVACPDP